MNFGELDYIMSFLEPELEFGKESELEFSEE